MSEEISYTNSYTKTQKKSSQNCLIQRKIDVDRIIDIFNNSGFFNGLYEIPKIADDLTSENLKIGQNNMVEMLEAFKEEILLLRYDFMYAIQEASISNNKLQTIIDNMKVEE